MKKEGCPAGKLIRDFDLTECRFICNLANVSTQNLPLSCAGTLTLASTLVMGVERHTGQLFDGGRFLMRSGGGTRWQCRTMERTSLMLVRNRPGLDRRITAAEELLTALAGTATRQTENPHFGGHAKATVAEMALGAGAKSLTTFSACALIGLARVAAQHEPHSS
jgi:hypothetical protein